MPSNIINIKNKIKIDQLNEGDSQIIQIYLMKYISTGSLYVIQTKITDMSMSTHIFYEFINMYIGIMSTVQADGNTGSDGIPLDSE